MNQCYTIGIDPGANGGIAVVDGTGSPISLTAMPPTPQDVYDYLKDCQDKAGGNVVCYLEKVGGMPGNGGMAMFHFGQGYGHLEMALLALGIPTTTATPQKWQKHYQLGSSSSCTKTEWKNKLKAKAQQIFPSVKVNLKIADALLIARYGHETRQRNGS